MTKRMLIDALHPEEKRVVIEDRGQILDLDFSTAAKKQIKGNIYLAKITRVEPSLQAAFVEYGGGKQGFLPFGEIHPDYYQIPAADRKRLMEEVAGEDLDDDADAPASEEPQPDAEGQFADTATDAAEDAAQAEAFTKQFNEAHTAAMEAPVSAPEITPAEDEPASMPAAAEPMEAQTSEPAELDAAPAQEEVETIRGEEEEIQQQRPQRRTFSKRYRIQEVIKRGQIVLVQVIKEERGNKGVSLTTFLSLAGRYCVLMPNSPRDGGVSRKIASGEDRKRLKMLMSELKLTNGMSVIIRTAGMDRTRAEIKRDYEYLVKLWDHIREDTLSSTAPAMVYEESDIIKRAIRDNYTNDIEELYIEGEDAYKRAKEFMKLLLPSHTARIKHYKEATPLFYAFGIEDQLLTMYEPSVRLRSGGYIVLNPTEALISIDVNSGRSTGERNIEETAAKTNLEAAWEIARQLRLRDLAGLIVIDFIDMMESRNRRAVERALKDALRQDRARIQIGRISPFGLLEMSRQRLRPSIAEATMVTCSHCTGRGHIRSADSLSIQIMRNIEKEAGSGNWVGFRINCSESVALHMLNTKRAALDGVEARYGITIAVSVDHSLPASHFTLEKNRRPKGEGKPVEDRPRRHEAPAEDAASDGNEEQSTEAYAPAEPTSEQPSEFSPRPTGDRGPRRRGRRGGRRFRGEREPRTDQPMEGNAAPIDDSTAPPQETAPGDAPQGEFRAERRPRGNRGGRGGQPRGGARRNWREDKAAAPAEGEAVRESAPAQPDLQLVTPPLPAFTQIQTVPVREPKPPAPVESTPKPENTRKGWWQKIIELD